MCKGFLLENGNTNIKNARGMKRCLVRLHSCNEKHIPGKAARQLRKNARGMRRAVGVQTQLSKRDEGWIEDHKKILQHWGERAPLSAC